jgi:hypothetical protein
LGLLKRKASFSAALLLCCTPNQVSLIWLMRRVAAILMEFANSSGKPFHNTRLRIKQKSARMRIIVAKPLLYMVFFEQYDCSAQPEPRYVKAG